MLTWSVHEIETLPPGEFEWVKAVHVLPDYGPEHSLIGSTCTCEPTVEYLENGNFIFIHRDLN